MSLLLARVQQFQYASATFTGVGQLTLVPTKVVSASITFAGTAALGLTPTRIRSGTVAFGGTGALALAPSVIRGGSVAFAGVGAMVLVPTKLPGAPVAAPFPLGGLPVARVRKRPAPKPVVPYHVPVDSASYTGLVRALWHVVGEVIPTPQPYAPVARPGRPVPQTVRRERAILTRRSPAVLPMAAPAEPPVERRLTATAPPAAPPRPRPQPTPVRPRPVVPGPTPPPVEVPAYPPEVEPESHAPEPVAVPAPPVPFAPDPVEQARIAAAIEEVTAQPAAAFLPAVPRVLPWDEEEPDLVALMLALLLED